MPKTATTEIRKRRPKLETTVRAVVAKTAGALAGYLDVRAAMAIVLPEGPLGSALREFLLTSLREKGLDVTPVSAPAWPEDSPALLVTEAKAAESDG